MAAYVIAEVNVTNPKLYEEYRKLVPATLDQMCGGKVKVRPSLEVIYDGV